MPRSTSKASGQPPPASVPFLLSQVGAHVSGCFAERIAPLGLRPYHAGILSLLARHAGITQQALSDLLGMFPSRLVGLLDELGKAKLIERRASPSDRRTYALHLTKGGRDTLAKIGKLAALMQDDLCAALNEKERALLEDLLTRIVAQQKITPGVHPGYRRAEGACGEEESHAAKG
ncbi:MAG: MarR family winged helix-turn-helix transcriptional regulator [Chthoniobacter sp.]|uniref:MarR family winged helix-turn-helix transcriptional regulator n=1 Tax=Chthoniobacter sp. TaxID=2510640 RepID=UPI0032A56B9C